MPDLPADRFQLDAPVQACEPLPGGHIHRSFRVETTSGRRYLLQRFNTRVFPHPAGVLRNIVLVTTYLAEHRGREPAADSRRSLRLVPARDGAFWLTSDDGAVWRMYHFIEGAVSHQRVEDPGLAYETGHAFGEFARLLADYAGPPLDITLPGFHDTPARVRTLEDVLARDPAGRASSARRESTALLRRRELARGIPPAGSAGGPPVRIAHHDAKVANVLFDAATAEALCVVDLDTVMPGTILHDFGDLVRSCTSPTAEDEADLVGVAVRPGLYRALARGYLEAAGGLLTPAERAHLETAGRVITYEQAVRFLADYLAGDGYYRVTDPEQNLRRCRTQLRLLETLEERQAELEAALL